MTTVADRLNQVSELSRRGREYRTLRYLVDDEAVDVSRMTGIPWSYERVHQRGVLHPFIDLDKLDWWDRMRVAFALIGGYFWSTHAPSS